MLPAIPQYGGTDKSRWYDCHWNVKRPRCTVWNNIVWQRHNIPGYGTFLVATFGSAGPMRSLIDSVLVPCLLHLCNSSFLDPTLCSANHSWIGNTWRNTLSESMGWDCRNHCCTCEMRKGWYVLGIFFLEYHLKNTLRKKNPAIQSARVHLTCSILWQLKMNAKSWVPWCQFANYVNLVGDERVASTLKT